MYDYKAKIIKVVDGDTVDAIIDCGFSIFLKQRVRLTGVNAPETRTKNLKEKEKGLAAKQWLKQWVEKEKGEVRISTQLDKKGKYDRVLGRLYDKHLLRCANTQIVESGHATEYRVVD